MQYCFFLNWNSSSNSAVILDFFIYQKLWLFHWKHTKFQEIIFQFGCKYVLRYFKGIFHVKSLLKTLMEYTIPGKLIAWNIIFYLVFKGTFLKNNWKISNIPLEIRYSRRYKFYWNWNNSSETAPNSIFIILFKRLAVS